MTLRMVEEVSHVHMQAFNGAMNTRLGKFYVRKFLEWFVRNEGGIALVAISKAGNIDQIVGYAVGAPLGYGKKMNRDLFWIASFNGIIRPWLFLSGQFRETIKARLTAIFKPSQNPALQVDLPSPAMSLVGLAVMPNYQGKSIGKGLLCAFQERARDLHVRSLRLSVYPENSAARSIYEKCGWLPVQDSGVSGKTIFYYMIL